MKIRTKDAVVQAVLRKMDERSLVGQKKIRSYNDARDRRSGKRS